MISTFNATPTMVRRAVTITRSGGMEWSRKQARELVKAIDENRAYATPSVRRYLVNRANGMDIENAMGEY